MEMALARLPSMASLIPVLSSRRAHRWTDRLAAYHPMRSPVLLLEHSVQRLVGTHADHHAAEFRGPGTHHHYDDSPDDFDMDMDQRTRFLGGRAGRIILLGDGTEILTGQIHDDDGDIDMEDRGEAEEADDDEDEQVPASSKDKPNGESIERSKREETPSPALQGNNTEPAEKGEEAKRQQAETGESEPKTAAVADSTDTKAAVDGEKA